MSAAELAEALSRLAAAEALAAAANARAEGERARADDERARADGEHARAEAHAKELFFVYMRSISSSSSSDTSSKADTARRGAPEPEPAGEGDGLDGAFPAADEAAVRSAWDAFRARHAASWRPPPAAARLRENRHVHPTVGCLLDAIVPRGALRVWHDKPAPDDVRRAHVRPDFTLTHVRDAAPTTVGASLIVEVKKPGGIGDAAYQACAYARRRVFKLCCEADARGEPLDGIFAFGVATDGARVVIARVASGAPPPGASFVGAVPCPVRQGAPLALLGDWDFRARPAFHDADAGVPAGFRALWRLCAAPRALGGAAEPLAALRVTLHGDAAPGGAREVTLSLGERLGCGGTSDVYVYSCDAGRAGAAAGGGALAGVAKVSRVATREVAAEFGVERDALAALAAAAGEGLVPTVVAFGVRVPDAARARAGDAEGAAPWPVLLLRPRGEALDAWVAARVAGAADSAAARLAAADDVMRRVLDALAAAHAAGWVHCDVRPANVVVVRGRAMLIDWGLAARSGAPLSPRSVPAFSDARLFDGTACAAEPRVDALGALFTWFAVAFGCGCAAPWLAGADPRFGDAGVLTARGDWLDARVQLAEGHASAERAARAARAVADIESGRAANALAAARGAVDGP